MVARPPQAGPDEAALDALFHALADATRRDILRRTLSAEATVSELAAAYDMSFAAVQKHVVVLEAAGLITQTPAGRTRRVRACPDQLARARGLLAQLEALGRDRFDRLDALLSTPAEASQPCPSPSPPIPNSSP